MRKKIIISLIILTVAAGAVGFWYYQKNVYSKEILKLEILGPQEADLGQEVEYTVKYKNNGNVRLEEARLLFEYPGHSIVENGETLMPELVLEDIYPGQEKTLTFKCRLLGKEGEIKKANVWLAYHPKNLKATYESSTSHSVQIKSVPLTLEMDLPSKIESGKEISFALSYFSNADYPLSDLGIKADYPEDFELKESNPESLGEIGLLNKAEGGVINLTGLLRGEVNEQKTFKAQLGIWRDGEFVLLKETVRAVRIVTPSIYIFQHINGSPKYVASPGDTLHYEIFFKNIGEEAFNNLFLVAKLEGEAFDFESLKAPYGEFEQGDNSVVFDWRRARDLQYLGAQQEGRVEFWIDLKEEWDAQESVEGYSLANKVYLSQAREEFITKVNTELEIVQKGYYVDEIFGNTGPLPPESGKTTTYTVTWQAKNHYNSVKNMKVSAVLGQGVSLTGKIFPEEANLTFDSKSREIVWRLERLHADKGVTGPGPNVSFQVAFDPSQHQEGEIAELVGEVEISGEDEFTGQTVEASDSALGTDLPDDDSVSREEGTVQ